MVCQRLQMTHIFHSFILQVIDAMMVLFYITFIIVNCNIVYSLKVPLIKSSTCSKCLNFKKINADDTVHRPSTNQMKLYCESENHSNVNINNKDSRDYKRFGPFQPLARLLDSISDGFALSYPDLSMYPPQSIGGVVFLATNIGYEIAGWNLQQITNTQSFGVPGICLEIAGIVSIWYHWAQLYYGPSRDEVRISLLADYFTASAAITSSLTALAAVLFRLNLDTIVLNSDLVGTVVCAGLGLLSLYWSWLEEDSENYARKYLIWHGLWHVWGALSAYYLGNVLLN